ncbi:MAG: lycopene cyclase family protein [Bacteroidota bacterium]
MTQFPEWDYILAGGGLAGLVMALKLQEKLGDFRALIIDRDPKKEDDRTWSYWTQHAEQLPDIAHQSWGNIMVYGREGEQHYSINPYRYYTVRGVDFYRYAQSRLQADERFSFLTDRIVDLNEGEGIIRTAEKGEHRAKWIFKSYFTLDDLSQIKKYNTLYQQFKGLVIETERPVFRADTVTLMDFRAKRPGEGIRFNYVLPFSERKAMVEYTAFSPRLLPEMTYDVHLEWYLHEVLGIREYQVHKSEFNVIPMTDYPFHSEAEGRVVEIGTIAGFVKGSTGYCFTRTFEKLDRLTEDLRRGKDPRQSTLASPHHFRLMDSILLDIMCRDRVPADLIFTNLYSKIPTSLLFRFLDEKANPLDILRVMWACPSKEKFVSSMMSQLFQLATNRRPGGTRPFSFFPD